MLSVLPTEKKNLGSFQGYKLWQGFQRKKSAWREICNVANRNMWFRTLAIDAFFLKLYLCALSSKLHNGKFAGVWNSMNIMFKKKPSELRLRISLISKNEQLIEEIWPNYLIF